MVQTPAPVDHVRADRVDLGVDWLPEPVTLQNGSVRFWGVAATTDPMSYAWGTERATPEALADEAYHEAVRGLPVIMRDEAHSDDVTLEDIRRYSIGTITDSRYDAQHGAHVVEVTVQDAEALQAIREGRRRGLSLRYRADVDAEGNQTRRHLVNHLHLTPPGGARGGHRAQIRADQSGDEMEEAIEKILAAIAGMQERMDGMMERYDAMMKDREDMEDEPGDRSDATLSEAVQVHELAQRLGVDIPDGATIEAAQRAVVAKVRGKERADAIDGAALADIVAIAATATPAAPDPKRPSLVTPTAETTGDRSDGADNLVPLSSVLRS